MGKNSSLCPWGDCPDLDHGPKSNEHEGRFIKRNKLDSLMVKSDSAMMINGDNAKNIAK